MEWALLPFKRYSEFSGRSRRKEFWSFQLMLVILSVIAAAIDGGLGMSTLVLGLYGPLTFLLIVVVITPHLSVSIRRLHDTGRPGWWLLLGLAPIAAMLLVPVAGWTLVAVANVLVAVVLLYYLIQDGTAGPNHYGPDPKEAERAAAVGTT